MIEFVSAFIVLLLLLVGITKIFVWMGSTIIGRNRAFEDSRTKAGNYANTNDPTVVNFYTKKDLKVFE
ncbi:MAG: hypothetical protein KAJ14_13945 [Candidatus Omnitrophica bacterium]|nr:hypothetical protein [Candidatus Omnitrophota bacterium]